MNTDGETAKEVENARYATGMLIASIVLAPCLYLGLMIIPERVQLVLEGKWQKRMLGGE